MVLLKYIYTVFENINFQFFYNLLQSLLSLVLQHFTCKYFLQVSGLRLLRVMQNRFPIFLKLLINLPFYLCGEQLLENRLLRLYCSKYHPVEMKILQVNSSTACMQCIYFSHRFLKKYWFMAGGTTFLLLLVTLWLFSWITTTNRFKPCYFFALILFCFHRLSLACFHKCDWASAKYPHMVDK